MVTEWDADRIEREVRRRAAVERAPLSARHFVMVCHDVFDAAGVGVQLIADDGALEPVHATTDVVERVIELETTLGEGPAHLAVAGGRAVAVDDFRQQRARWPLFSDAAEFARVRAALAFPMWLGSGTIGAVEVYSPEPRLPTTAELDLGGVFTELLTDQIVTRLDEVGADAPEEFGIERFHIRWQVVYQATAIASIHLRCGLPEASLRLRAHAFASGRRLCEVAEDVVTGVVRLAPDDPFGLEAP
ncbi:GAF domain-containing protein [Kutzneria buriramensis]|uniref:GAF domain-containing protein n=1 Tax=Kutzneria buriramensis TaxID=1045776 RepID=A0A3E0GYY7_9PSEU|nr:GAF domain-containing protein [Kutzneria buriramensis]REH34876.1 hypothetical protein BCF44_119152 [Kutzneria buriramensis]